MYFFRFFFYKRGKNVYIELKIRWFIFAKIEIFFFLVAFHTCFFLQLIGIIPYKCKYTSSRFNNIIYSLFYYTGCIIQQSIFFNTKSVKLYFVRPISIYASFHVCDWVYLWKGLFVYLSLPSLSLSGHT